MKKNIFITAGGTGGHIFPALAVASDLVDDCQIVWVGTSSGIEKDIVSKKLPTVIFHGIKVKGVRKTGFIFKMLNLPILLVSFLQSFYLLMKYRPYVVVGFGGYVTFPICLLSAALTIPVIIHEQNAIMGLSNRVLAKFAKKILLGFELTSSGASMASATSFPNAIQVGNPIRKEIMALHKTYDNDDSLFSKHESQKINILVLGGSLGAKTLNTLVPKSLIGNVGHVLHQVGPNHDALQVIQTYHDNHIYDVEVVNFINDMASAYKSADLVICRAGAITVSEIATVGIAAIFIPYPYAVDDHQWYNAMLLVKMNAALCIAEKDLTVEKLREIISWLTYNQCCQMGKAAVGLANANSTKKIVSIIKKYF